MKKINLNNNIYITVDKEVFFNEKEANLHELNLYDEIKEHLDLRRFINIKEKFYEFPPQKSGMNILGQFEVSDVTENTLTVKNLEEDNYLTYDFSNWMVEHRDQIIRLIHKMRGNSSF